jgi:phage terminase large subunit GpA-like protein
LTQGIDVGKFRLHYVVKAWRPDATGYVIDYDTQDIYGARHGTDVGLDQAIYTGIRERMDTFREAAYMTATGEKLTDVLTLCDAGYRTTAVYSACGEIGQAIYPVMGFGQSMGSVRMSFGADQKRTKDVRPGDGWRLSRQGKVWLVEAHSDRWKAWEHDRWMTAADAPGACFIFGESPENPDDDMTRDQLEHLQFARQICNEEEVEEVVHGRLKRYWKTLGRDNHYLDASYYADVAASMKGIRLPVAPMAKTGTLPEHATQERKRMTLRDLAQQARSRRK